MIEMDMPKIEVEESEDQSYAKVEEYSCPRSPVRRRRE